METAIVYIVLYIHFFVVCVDIYIFLHIRSPWFLFSTGWNRIDLQDRTLWSSYSCGRVWCGQTEALHLPEVESGAQWSICTFKLQTAVFDSSVCKTISTFAYRLIQWINMNDLFLVEWPSQFQLLGHRLEGPWPLRETWDWDSFPNQVAFQPINGKLPAIQVPWNAARPLPNSRDLHFAPGIFSHCERDTTMDSRWPFCGCSVSSALGNSHLVCKCLSLVSWSLGHLLGDTVSERHSCF